MIRKLAMAGQLVHSPLVIRGSYVGLCIHAGTYQPCQRFTDSNLFPLKPHLFNANNCFSKIWKVDNLLKFLPFCRDVDIFRICFVRSVARCNARQGTAGRLKK